MFRYQSFMTFHFLGFIHWTVSIYFFVLRLLHDSENDLLNSFLENDPYCRPKLSDLYILWQSKLLENHTFHSGTYLYSPYLAVPPSRPARAGVVPVKNLHQVFFLRNWKFVIPLIHYFFLLCSSITHKKEGIVTVLS